MSNRRKPLYLFLIASVTLILVGSWMTIEETGANFYSKDTKAYQTGRGDLRVELADKETIPATVAVNQVSKREVTIRNKGAVSQFIRVLALPVAKNTHNLSVASPPEAFLESLNTSEWKNGKDGYFYYLNKLEEGQETPPLFKGVKSTTPGTVTIALKVEAVTAENTRYVEAWWNGGVPSNPPELGQINQVLKPQTEEVQP